MSNAVLNRMSLEEFLALPEDDMDRELIEGELREEPMTYRNPVHSEVVITVGYFLKQWALGQASRPYRVVSAEAGFLLKHEPPTLVGIDVAVAEADLIHASRSMRAVEGVPLVAVEVLSPSDQHRQTHEKLRLYLDCGVAEVWLVDPEDRTIRIYQKGHPPVFYHEGQQLEGRAALPGLSIRVAEVFD